MDFDDFSDVRLDRDPDDLVLEDWDDVIGGEIEEIRAAVLHRQLAISELEL